MNALRISCGIVFLLLLAGCERDNAKYVPKSRQVSDPDDPKVSLDELLKKPAGSQNATVATVAVPKLAQDVANSGVPSAQPAIASNSVSPTNAPNANVPPTQLSPATVPPVAAPAMRNSELTRRQLTLQRLLRISQALEAYHQKNSVYPAAKVPIGASNVAVSWRVQLLPILGLGQLYSQYRITEPWDSPANRQLLAQIPDVYQSPERQDEKTNFQLVTGSGTVYPSPTQVVEDHDVRDGAGATVFLAEVGDHLACPWTKPDDYLFEPARVQQDLFSLRRDCCFVVLGKGVGPRRLSATISDANLLALLSPNGGERVTVESVAEFPRPDVDETLIEQLTKSPLSRFDQATTKTAGDVPGKEPPSSPANPATEKLAVAESTRSGPRDQRSDQQPNDLSVDAPRREKPMVEAPETADDRWPIPTEEAIRQAGDLVRDLFGDEYDRARKAKDVASRRTFARKLLDEADKAGSDAAGVYVLLRAAREISLRAQDLETALRAADQMGRRFQIDELTNKAELLESMAPNLKDRSDYRRLYETGIKLGDQALALDDFVRARTLYRLALAGARHQESSTSSTPGGSLARGRAGNGVVASRENSYGDAERAAQARENRLRDTRQAYARVSSALHTLLRTPDDPTANAAVGRYFCLIKDDWAKGLPLLAKGNDEVLRRLANVEAKLPSDAEARVQLADDWWTWSDSTNVELEKQLAQLRAAHWYRQSLPDLPPSLTRTRAEKRLEQMKLVDERLRQPPNAAQAAQAARTDQD